MKLFLIICTNLITDNQINHLFYSDNTCALKSLICKNTVLSRSWLYVQYVENIML